MLNSKNTQRPIVILSWVILLVILFSLFGTLILERGLWWLGGILGILLGFRLGVYFSSLLTAVFEWVAQVLIAQGEIIATRQ